jgi:shikimate kinase
VSGSIVLIGPMGAGKSAVGAAVASRLHRVFLDTDRIVEESAGATIEKIFSERGETEFRKLEAEAVEQAAVQDRAVIACGGGAVLNGDNVEALRQAGTIIYLRVSPEVAAKRIDVNFAGGRPLLSEGDLESRLRKIIDQRSGAYETAADDEVDADLDLNQIVEQVLQIAGDSR